MKKLKKLALLITVAIMLTLAACGSKAVAPTTTASEAAGTSVTTESTESAEVADTAELINQVEPDGSYENPYPMETREFPGTVEGLQLIEENCHFDGDTTYYTSADGKFLFSRFSSLLSVDILSVDGRRDFTSPQQLSALFEHCACKAPQPLRRQYCQESPEVRTQEGGRLLRTCGPQSKC